MPRAVQSSQSTSKARQDAAAGELQPVIKLCYGKTRKVMLKRPGSLAAALELAKNHFDSDVGESPPALALFANIDNDYVQLADDAAWALVANRWVLEELVWNKNEEHGAVTDDLKLAPFQDAVHDKARISIRLVDLDGDETCCSISKTTRIAKLYVTYAEQNRIDRGTIKLFHAGRVLLMNDTIESCGIKNNDRIHVLGVNGQPPLSQTNEMVVSLKTLTGKTIPFGITETTTVVELKMMIADTEGISIDQQRLIFAGRQLEDGRLLADYRVKAGSTLHLALRQVGGKPVILFYYPEPVSSVQIHLALRNCWDFSAIYPVTPIKRTPKGQTISWNVDVENDGLTSVSDPSIRYSSLFWEAETNPSSARGQEDGLSFDPRKARLDCSNALVFTFKGLVPFLESTLRALQLTDTAATDFMQYWIPNFTKLDQRDMDIAVRFLPMAELDEVAALSIQPAPDSILRVFMLFKGVSKSASASWDADQKALVADWLSDVPAGFQDPSKQRVLEWGGMQVY